MSVIRCCLTDRGRVRFGIGVPVVAILLVNGGLSGCAGPPPGRPPVATLLPPVAMVLSQESAGDLDIDDLDEDILRLVELHNREREKADLPPLTLEEHLIEAARRHARDMAERGKMTHTGSDGSSFSERIERTGYKYRRVGENVAAGQMGPEEAVRGWMDSRPHKKNILGNFTQIGAAVATDSEGRAYWCVTFGDSWPQLDPAQASADLIEAINARREQEGLALLRDDPRLSAAARQFAQALAERHKRQPEPDAEADPDDHDPDDPPQPDPVALIDAEGYRYRTLGVNAASGQTTPDEALQALIASDHDPEKGILGSFDDIGAGHANTQDGVPYWCVILARPLNPSNRSS